MIVRRTLPQRQRSLIGPWCFVDHYGPADVSVTGGMDVAPHPHTGLQTVSWLFEGAIQHIDSGGNAGLVLPGEVNLMTAGRGICHSEVSTEETTTLHGVQLWLALPEATRHQPEREFEHFARLVSFDGGRCSSSSENSGERNLRCRLIRRCSAPRSVWSGRTIDLPLDEPSSTESSSIPVTSPWRTFRSAGQRHRIHGRRSDRGCASATARRTDGTTILIGGEPFGEEIVMWWNFIGRTHRGDRPVPRGMAGRRRSLRRRRRLRRQGWARSQCRRHGQAPRAEAARRHDQSAEESAPAGSRNKER